MFYLLGDHCATSLPVPEASVQEESEHHVEVPQPEDDALPPTVQQRIQPAALVTDRSVSLHTHALFWTQVSRMHTCVLFAARPPCQANRTVSADSDQMYIVQVLLI